MCKYILSCLALLPLLVPCSQAAQTWSVDPPAQPWVFSSEDGGGGGYLGEDRLVALALGLGPHPDSHSPVGQHGHR